MHHTQRLLPTNKKVAVVAHDHRKADLIRWCQKNYAILAKHTLFGTGTTALLVAQETNLAVTALLSGPMGGDQQIGSMIAQAELDALIFFWDPLNAVPHDPDVKALLRLAAVWNIPVATNESSADLMFTNPKFNEPVSILIPDYERYIAARVNELDAE